MTTASVILSGYAVGLASGLIAWLVRKAINNS